MMLFTKEIVRRLAANGQKEHTDMGEVPVVQIFGGSSLTWLLTDSDPENPDRLFGLCDLGLGFPEMGYVSREWLETVKVSPWKMPLERERYFRGEYPLRVYAKAALSAGSITFDSQLLEETARSLGLE